MRWFSRLFLIFAFFVAAPTIGVPVFTAAVSQDAIGAPDYVEWEKVAGRAEIALADRRASNSALEALREELVNWRTRFLDAQGINETRIATLRNQITALGPTPEAGTTEPEDLAARRTTLSTQLASLEAPKRSAEEAYSRADGLIRETDTIVRERQTERLLELGPSPLNPVHWTGAFRDMTGSIVLAGRSIDSAWKSQTQQILLRENLPVTIFYAIIALVLLSRGRRWVDRLTTMVRSGTRPTRRRFVGFIVSIGQVVLPYVGILAFAEALYSTGLLGFRGQIIADALPQIGLAFFGARWLGMRLFPKIPNPKGLTLSSPEMAARGRFTAGVLGLLFGLNMLLTQMASFEGYSDATRAVLHFPLIILSGFLLFRMGRILLGFNSQNTAEAVPDRTIRTRAIDLTARALLIIGIAGPVVASVGYLTGSLALVFPTIVSLGLLALLTIISGVARDGYSLVSGYDEEGAQDALMPVLLSLGLTLLSVPFFALIWGARVSDLSEIWARFREGFQIGDSRISPTDFLTFAVVFAIGYALTRMLQSTLKGSVLPKTQIDQGGQTAIVSGLGYVGIFLAAVIGISTAGIDLSSLAIVAGALSVGIGFGLQNIVSNFVAGIILLIERPITEGDWIEVGGQMGYVRDISVRSTRIETFDRTDVIIPNADLVSGAVINYTRGNLIGRAIVPVGVAYGTDTRKVQQVLTEIAEAHPMVSLNPAPAVHFVGFGADSMDFEIRAILRDVNFGLSVKTEINHQIAERFAVEGIEIPFAQRDVWLRNPEALVAAQVSKGKTRKTT